MNPRFYHIPMIRRLYSNAIWQMEEEEAVIYLSFDDGPHPEITPWVLDLLDEFNQKGTFFCIGKNVAGQASVIDRIVDEGHALGNHTFNHESGFGINTKLYLQSIRECGRLLESKLFRPPYGRMRFSQYREIVDQTDMQIVMWSILSLDYLSTLNVASSLKNMKRLTKPGAIVVFHDSQKAEKNLKILLPAYLNYLKSTGYQSKAIVL